MTPEQTRNYWILEGYPLMPEWIEFCRGYIGIHYEPNSLEKGEAVNALVESWYTEVQRVYGVQAVQLGDSYSGFMMSDKGPCAYRIGKVIYDWREDHAI